MLFAEVLLSLVQKLFPACSKRNRTDLDTIQQIDSNFWLVNIIQFKLIFLRSWFYYIKVYICNNFLSLSYIKYSDTQRNVDFFFLAEYKANGNLE